MTTFLGNRKSIDKIRALLPSDTYMYAEFVEAQPALVIVQNHKKLVLKKGFSLETTEDKIKIYSPEAFHKAC